MLLKYQHSGTLALILILILSLAGCSNHVAAASIQEDAVEIRPNAEMTPVSTSEMRLAETPIEIVSTISSPKQSNVEFLRESPTPTYTTVQPTPIASQSRIQIEVPIPEFKVCSPIAGVELNYLTKIISDPYRPPPPGSDDRHEGVDFSYYNLAGRRTFIAGVGIQSVLPGIVAAAITNSFPYGNFVIVETPREWLPVAMRHRLDIPDGSSLYLLYAHMQSSPEVTLGGNLEGCQLIGKVGQSGNSAVAHLHLEARSGPAGAAFVMMAAFQPTVSPEERANYKLWRTSGLFVHFDPMLVFELK
ncbi:MAG: hypothetical protein A2Z16_05265 [Chloroflexi bacterium RBG_16_54_18]|nr:MAG: hypothetical protein A2Z16_05265 [Chloroflexi bacterium RBG_16_54_18]